DYWGTAPQTSSLVYQWDDWGTAPQTSSPVSMGLLAYCTPNLLTSFSNLQTSLNRIIAVIHSKTYQSQSDYWGTAPQTSSLVYQWDDWGAAPQTSSPVSMGILGCCTPKLLTSFSNQIGRAHV